MPGCRYLQFLYLLAATYALCCSFSPNLWARGEGARDGIYSNSDAADDNFNDALWAGAITAGAGGLTLTVHFAESDQLRPSSPQALMDAAVRHMHPHDIVNINRRRMEVFSDWQRSPTESARGPQLRFTRNLGAIITALGASATAQRGALAYIYQERDQPDALGRSEVYCLMRPRPEHAAYRCENPHWLAKVLDGAAYERAGAPLIPRDFPRNLIQNGN